MASYPDKHLAVGFGYVFGLWTADRRHRVIGRMAYVIPSEITLEI
jgi:hypothetical protein